MRWLSVIVLVVAAQECLCLPLGETNEVVPSASTAVNSVKRAELPEILDTLDKLRLAIKAQAFEAFTGEALQRQKTVSGAMELVDSVTRVMEESLRGLAMVRAKVESIRKSGKPLTEEESIFLENVRSSIPDILSFTAEQYLHVAEAF